MKLMKNKGIAVLLTFAMALTGVAIPTSGNKAKAEETGAVVPTTTKALTGAAADLNALINATWVEDENKQEKVRIQKVELNEPDVLLEAYAAHILLPKNSGLKIEVVTVDSDGNPVLFAKAGKTLSVYGYTFGMTGTNAKNYKPLAKIKNVKEVRKGSAKKGTFLVKTVSGKTTSYITYTYDPFSPKKTVFTKTGKTYKKGSKKITKKVFDKNVKTFNKAKKIKLRDPNTFYEFYRQTDYLFMNKGLYVLHASDDITVMNHDSANTTDPYKIFTCANSPRIRYVLGKDEAKDWNEFRKQNMNPTRFITDFNSFITEPNMYDVTYTKDEAKKEGKYLITFSSEAGFDGDTSWEVYTDESGATPKIKSSKSFTSVGVYDMMIDFLYGDDAEVDGELYEPGSSEEAFAEAPFNTSENNIRTLTVDYAGTKKEVKTIGDYRFEPWTDSTKGTFTLKDENKTYSWMDLNLDTDDWYAANRLINPDSGDAGGYGAPTATLTWAAK